ncbi:MAG TPA: hypothetical protein VEC16_01680, partial [Alphaproteobacteria bacterium]|nr:hypothetical protein [Alphaproteobacteria bacterium]
ISFGPKIVEKNVTLISYTPVKTSFERFSQISGPSYSEETSVLGYLRLETTTNANGGETTTRYVVDDYDNKIRLIVDDKYSTHFSVNSKITYNVSGLYHNTLNGYVLDVENIVKQNRELVETSTQRLENVTEGDKAGIKISLSQGWGKISNVLR